MKKRVLFVRRTDSYGGSEAVILDLLKGIDYEKVMVYLASIVNVFSGPISRLKLPVKWVPLTTRFGGGFLKIFVSSLCFLMRLRPHKIILAEGSFFDFPLAAVLAAFVAARGNVSMIEMHPAPELPPKTHRKHFGFLPGVGFWWYAFVWSSCARAYLSRHILALSHGVKDRLVRYYRYPSEKVHVVHHGVDPSRFVPASAGTRRSSRATLNIPDDATVIVSTARLDRIKRLDRAIKAFHTLSGAHKNLSLLFTGGGPLREELEVLAKSVDADHRIRFLGHVEDVKDVLRASDIYVLPSDEEGFGIALAEAMSSKLICVATKTTGSREIIDDGKNGILVEPSDNGVLEGLKEALRLSKKERDSMSASARQSILENFRVENAIAGSLALMDIDQIRVSTAS